jgi:uncharacterized protein (TIGR04255 family)
MIRKCRSVPLTKQPLALVLAQVRFSSILKMGDFIPEIQEEFRRHGFPLDRSGKFQQIVIGPPGGLPIQVIEQQRWEYRSMDGSWSILVMSDAVVLQATTYTSFETFAERLELALRTVLTKTEHDRFGAVQRLGLRYIDVVQPREGEDHRFYLRPGFHGASDSVFAPGTQRLFVESVGRTAVGDLPGTLIIRVVQNDQGFTVPPDLLAAAPELVSRAKPGELLTLIDMDHYLEGTFEPDVAWVVARAYELHDQLIEGFHEHVVTPEAIEAWR